MREGQARPLTMVSVRPVVASAATLAAGIMRSIAITAYAPASRRREFEQIAGNPGAHATRCRIFREKGAGTVPTIVLGGFVPDATETVEFQRSMLRRHGSIYYLNYPRSGFCRQMFSAQLSDLIEDLYRKGQKPLVMGVSFGAGLLVEFLKTAPEQIHQMIRGLVLASPVICTDDLIRPSRTKGEGVRIFENNLKKILAADSDNHDELKKTIERARRCFQALFNAGAENRILGVRHLSIRRKINGVIEQTSARGGFERVRALGDFRFPDAGRSVFAGPVLVLLAEREDDILVQSSPTLALFREGSCHEQIFPRCSVKTVRSGNPDDGVAHASLIFHCDAYNSLIDGWYHKILYPRLQMAV